MRVPLNTHAPLTLPGTLSTAGHWDQSSLASLTLAGTLKAGIPAKRHGAEVRYRVSAGTEMSNFGDGLSIGYLYVQAIQFPFPLIGYGFSHLHHQVNSQSAYWPLR